MTGNRINVADATWQKKSANYEDPGDRSDAKLTISEFTDGQIGIKDERIEINDDERNVTSLRIDVADARTDVDCLG